MRETRMLITLYHKVSKSWEDSHLVILITCRLSVLRNSIEEIERSSKTAVLGIKAKRTHEDSLRLIMFIEREQRSRPRGTKKLTGM